MTTKQVCITEWNDDDGEGIVQRVYCTKEWTADTWKRFNSFMRRHAKRAKL